MITVETRQRLYVERVSFQVACVFIAAWHRHHRPPQGHVYSLGVFLSDWTLVGVATVGRPVARLLDDGRTHEVTRVATDGTSNACSALYAAAWRRSRQDHYVSRMVTYTQDGESGASLRGAGWRVTAKLPARAGWSCPSRPRQTTGNEHTGRLLWEPSGSQSATIERADAGMQGAAR